MYLQVLSASSPDPANASLRPADGYNAQDMLYQWASSKVYVDPDVSIAQYELIEISTGEAKVVVQRKGECV